MNFGGNTFALIINIQAQVGNDGERRGENPNTCRGYIVNNRKGFDF